MEKIKKVISLLIVITSICQNTVFCAIEQDYMLRPPVIAEQTHDDGRDGSPVSEGPVLSQRLRAALSLILVASSLQAQKPPSNVPFYPEAQDSAYVMQFDSSSGNPKKPDKRLSIAKRLLLAGLVAGGSFYMAKHNPRLRRVLLLDVAGYGSVPMVTALGRKDSKSTVFDIWLQGMTSGLVMYAGKQILVDNIDTPGMGLVAKSVHTFGVSMNRNLTLGKPALNRFEIDIGPALIGVQRNEKKKVRPDIALLPGSLAVLLEHNILKGNQFDTQTFLRTGALSFRTEAGNLGDYHGVGHTNIISMIKLYRLYLNFDKALAVHEAMHTFQYSQNYFLGLWFDNRMWPNNIGVKSIRVRWDRDYGYVFSHMPDFLRPGAPHNRRLLEKEPRAWWNYLYPSPPSVSNSSLIPSILIPAGTMLILLDPFKYKSNSGAPVKEPETERESAIEEKLQKQSKDTTSSL